MRLSLSDVYSPSLTAHRMRLMEESTAAANGQPQRESEWQMPRTSSARHPNVVYRGARPILVALREEAE